MTLTTIPPSMSTETSIVYSFSTSLRYRSFESKFLTKTNQKIQEEEVIQTNCDFQKPQSQRVDLWILGFTTMVK